MSITHVFSLTDICRAKTIPVEIKDDSGNVEGVVYLKEPSAIEGVKLQESITAEVPWHVLVMNILALTLSDANGNALVTNPAERKQLEAMPPRMLVLLRDPCLAMLSMSWSTTKEDIATDAEDIDVTLANLDDQVAATHRPADITLQAVEVSNESESVIGGSAIPIEGNEHLQLDKDTEAGDSTTAVDPTNPFVATVEVPSFRG